MNFGKKGRDMSHPESKPVAPVKPERTAPTVEWSRRSGFKPFGDRINFLSPERQHLSTGKLTILPPRNPEKRNGRPKTS